MKRLIPALVLLIAAVLALPGAGDAQEVTAKVQTIPTKKPAKVQTATATPRPTKTVTKLTAKPTTKPTVKPTTKAVASSDLDLLARVVMAEAGGECDEMQLLVANVVINRMRDRRFPDTLRGVVYQRGQYACSGKLGRVKPNARAVKNAKRVLDGERFCPAKVVFQSEFRQGKALWKKVGNQYFCY